jgi:hypothetical protein
VKSATTNAFWDGFNRLPIEVQAVARKNYQLWRLNHLHPSLHFKKVGEFWSVRIGDSYRALGFKEGDYLVWVWIGKHDEYTRMIR